MQSNAKNLPRKHYPRPNKLLGQHFLVDQNILRKIINAAAIKNTETVLEVGPGQGVLTLALAKLAKKVIAVEKDLALAATLKEKLARRKINNVELIAGDILKMPDSFFAHLKPYRVVANIPYYLTARLIRKLLEEVVEPQNLLLTIQQEVAWRLAAKPPRMNLLALAVQVYGTPKIIFKIPRKAFWPPPEVDSALIAIENISKQIFPQSGVSERGFFKIIRGVFRTKRKILLNSLGRETGLGKSFLIDVFTALGIPIHARPEELRVDQWISLVARLKKNS